MTGIYEYLQLQLIRQTHGKGGERHLENTDVKDLYFGLYCKTCRYYFMPANKRPCRDCIGEPLNQETHRPQKWETGI